MYTVLIQSKRTMDSFQQFYPILSESIEAGNVDVCQWIEAGETVDSALPELYELISRKRSWKAVIVCSEFDEEDTPYPADSFNPYDFEENKGRTGLSVENGEIVDCASPLIRLTHMLGGIPAPSPKFNSRIVDDEEGKVPRLEYYKCEDEEAKEIQEAYRKWNEKHIFKGQPPLEIDLIKVRRATPAIDTFPMVQQSWQLHTEADSSEFWKRNLYPHGCRFMVYEMQKRGVMQRQNDLFRFWNAVLLVALNMIDPNVLQAHRLYRLDLEVNEQKLSESFQHTVNKLNMARFQLEKSLDIDQKLIEENENAIPDYTMDVPITFQSANMNDMYFNPSGYHLSGGVGSGDFSRWDDYSQNAKKEMKNLLKSIDRTLDQASDKMRGKCSYAPSEVMPLSKYQEEDLANSLGEVYKNILREQEGLPATVSDYEEDIAKANDKVVEELRRRMTRGRLVLAFVIPIVAMALAIAPAFYLHGTYLETGIIIGAATLLFLITGFVVAILQRKRLIRLCKDYQEIFQNIISEIAHNATLFSKFLSDVGSHVRGQSYLNQVLQKKQLRNSTYYRKKKDLKRIDSFLNTIAIWSNALHVSVNMDSVDIEELFDEFTGDVDYESLYSFDVGKDFSVPLNRSGSNIWSPFGFLERVIIDREEVYEDNEE